MKQMSKLNQLRAELVQALEKDFPTVSVGALSSALDEIDQLHAELELIRLDAFKIQIERDAIAELHKQVVREVLNGTYSHKETQDPSSAV